MKLLRLLHAILREIFDEAAYERFCARLAADVSPKSYADYLHEMEEAQRSKVKCC